ncbi:hypothetical protein [Streptomyces sp. NPDC005955]|uniref:hypothetical protein n=1 Tax=Streptomyces sp. NPDC005955 TaxID=3364738 RepID=UPI00367BBCA9
MLLTADTDADLEVFLTEVGRHLAGIGAQVSIDLYVDEEIADPGARRLYEELRRTVREERERAGGRTWRRESYMAVPLDLGSGDGLTAFVRLAHRTIGSEAVLADRIVFSTVENERIVRLRLPAADVDRLVARAREAGARSLAPLPPKP